MGREEKETFPLPFREGARGRVEKISTLTNPPLKGRE